MTIKKLYELALANNAEDYIVVSYEWGDVSPEEINWDKENKIVTI